MKKNYYSATATAAKITKVPVEVIRAGFRKGCQAHRQRAERRDRSPSAV